MKKLNNAKTVFIIDGSSFLYRAYYSLRPLYTATGEPVQAVYSFCRMIKKLLDSFKPEYVALVWDSKWKTVRHEIFPEYKATRQAPPSDLFTQKERINEFAEMIGLPTVIKPGIEADDLMNSVAQDMKKQGYDVVLITSDKDMTQLLNDTIHMYDAFKDEFIDEEKFQDKYGFPVEKLPFYFSLLGDSSDNIPGVYGIGQKGATELVTQFTSLENLYNNLDQVKKDRTRKLLEESRNNAFLSLELFKLRYFDLGLTASDLQFDRASWIKAKPIFEALQFKSMLKDLEKFGTGSAKETESLSVVKGYKFIAVTTEEMLDFVIEQAIQYGAFAFDTEGTAIDPYVSDCVGISLCYEKGTSYYIPFGHDETDKQLSQELVVKKLRPLFANPDVKKYLHHAKYDLIVMSVLGIEVQGVAFDTLIAASLVTQDWQSIGLKNLSQHYLGETMFTFAETVTKKGYKHFGQVPIALATEYSGADAHQTFQLVSILQKELIVQNMQ